MRKGKMQSPAVIETLESRKLLSASVAKIDSDLATLSAAMHVEALAAKQFLADLLAAYPVGTAGRKGVDNHGILFHTAIKVARAQLAADILVVNADVNHPVALAAADSKLSSDLTTDFDAVTAAYDAVGVALQKHPNILNNGALTSDKNAVDAEIPTLKSDYATVQADLA